MSVERAVDWATQRFSPLPAVLYLELTPLSSVEQNTTDVAMKYGKLAGWVVSNVALALVNLVAGMFEAVFIVVYGIASGFYHAWIEIRIWIDSSLSLAVQAVEGTQTGLVFVSFLLPVVLACTYTEDVPIRLALWSSLPYLFPVRFCSAPAARKRACYARCNRLNATKTRDMSLRRETICFSKSATIARTGMTIHR